MENSPAPLMDLVDRLLAPVPGDDPTGPSARYDPVMAQIRVAREADDPSLPLGEWERPLKKADWPLVVKLCTQILSERSKDLQVAAWLTEAWIHLHQLDGLRAGTLLINGLLETYWKGVHPQQDEDGDYEARIAPLAWMNETLPLTLRLQVALLPWPDRKPAFISLEDWTKAPLVAPPHKDVDADDDPGTAYTPSREELILVGATTAAPLLLQLREDLAMTMADWKALDQLVDNRLGKEAPSMSRVMDTLGLIDRASNSLLSKRLEQPTSEPQIQPGNAINNEETMTPSVQVPEPGPIGLTPKDDFADSDLRLATGPIRSRADAYRQLEGIANFLQSIEPHSPTPYLIRRAVSWGRMPLPELMQEVLREEGDLNRLFTVLGLAPQKDL
jgi:type VI secretion system protein ImpA